MFKRCNHQFKTISPGFQSCSLCGKRRKAVAVEVCKKGIEPGKEPTQPPWQFPEYCSEARHRQK